MVMEIPDKTIMMKSDNKVCFFLLVKNVELSVAGSLELVLTRSTPSSKLPSSVNRLYPACHIVPEETVH